MIAVVRLSSNSQNNGNSDDGSNFFNCTNMLTRGLAEPYLGPSTMVKEGGVPANFR
jgi:hypothetical protein